MDEPVQLSSLTSHLICKLCSGYLIEATTIIECLHTFCKSCIVRYLDEDNKCPECQLQIHQSHPLSYIMLDRKMQDIVYKAVPGLQAKEEQRIKDFYAQRKLPLPQEVQSVESSSTTERASSPREVDQVDKSSDTNCHRNDTQVSILMMEGENMPALEKKYLLCSIYTTIKTLKRYLSQHLYKTDNKHHMLDIFCQKELMGKEHSVEFVLRTRWRSKHLPLELEYRQRVDML